MPSRTRVSTISHTATKRTHARACENSLTYADKSRIHCLLPFCMNCSVTIYPPRLTLEGSGLNVVDERGCGLLSLFFSSVLGIST